MSTTFDVYASSAHISSFNSALSLCNKYLWSVLQKHNIKKQFSIEVCTRKNIDHSIVSVDKSQPALWNEDEYAWFTVSNVSGGCDAYFSKVDQLTINCWKDEFLTNTQAQILEDQIRKCFDTGVYWHFRPSAGQPEIISLSHGLIAAAFAKLTNGFIFSDDGAWDYDIFPTDTDTFLRYYFDTNYPKKEYSRWAKECLSMLKEGKR